MSNYPEHDKLSAVSDSSQAIGEFLDWLECGGLDAHLSDESGLDGHVGDERYGSVLLAFRPLVADAHPGWTAPHGARVRDLQPLGWGIEKLLAAYFQIDLGRIEEEKRKMIAKLDEMNTATPAEASEFPEESEESSRLLERAGDGRRVISTAPRGAVTCWLNDDEAGAAEDQSSDLDVLRRAAEICHQYGEDDGSFECTACELDWLVTRLEEAT